MYEPAKMGPTWVRTPFLKGQETPRDFKYIYIYIFKTAAGQHIRALAAGMAQGVLRFEEMVNRH